VYFERITGRIQEKKIAFNRYFKVLSKNSEILRMEGNESIAS